MFAVGHSHELLLMSVLQVSLVPTATFHITFLLGMMTYLLFCLIAVLKLCKPARLVKKFYTSFIVLVLVVYF